MRVLLVSLNFPPYNASGAVRVGHLAAYLARRGHDLRVVAGDGLPYPADFNLPLPGVTVERVGFSNIVAPLDWVRRRSVSKGGGAGNGNGASPSWGYRLANAYRTFIAFPDAHIGWLRPALKAARAITVRWRPDVVLSSALPFTCHLVAARIAREQKCAWVAEYRDLFADNPYDAAPPFRQALNRWLERRTLASVTECVTVSSPLAATLHNLHGKPTRVVLTGYDPAVPVVTPARVCVGEKRLRIVYTGIIYPGRRDPRPLFEAMRRLGERGRRIDVAFYGQDLRGVDASAREAGVADRVSTHAPVPHEESLRLQAEADALLLLLWNDPRERGIITGKLFEYLRAGRRILVVGCEDGVAGELVRERGLGAVASTPDVIAAVLSGWLDELDHTGALVGPPPAALSGLSRAEQLSAYEQLLHRAAGLPPGSVA